MKKSFIVLFHVVFWLPQFFQMYIYLSTYRSATTTEVRSLDFDRFYKFTMINNTIAIAVSFIVFYLFYFYLFPHFISKQQIKRFLFYGFLLTLIATSINLLSTHFFLIRSHSYTSGFQVIITYINDGVLFFKLAALGLTACMLKGFIGWYDDIRYKKELENRNLQTELALLKAQINPHFLFNTLNNIDILIEKNAETASVYLKKLSDLLRFTLYESPAETIPLAKEIAGIEQYIDLQKIRTSNANFVKFEVRGDTDRLYIAPMIFMPFVENAFKHSTNKKLDGGIEILITINHNEINFRCVNIFDNTQILQQPNSGLGLELMNSRLNLFYRGKHTLTISKENNLFSVNLMIRADDH